MNGWVAGGRILKRESRSGHKCLVTILELKQ